MMLQWKYYTTNFLIGLSYNLFWILNWSKSGLQFWFALPTLHVYSYLTKTVVPIVSDVHNNYPLFQRTSRAGQKKHTKVVGVTHLPFIPQTVLQTYTNNWVWNWHFYIYKKHDTLRYATFLYTKSQKLRKSKTICVTVLIQKSLTLCVTQFFMEFLELVDTMCT